MIFLSSFLTVFEVKFTLFQAVNDERWKSNLSLYCTVVYCTVAPVAQQSIAVLHSRQWYYRSGRTAIYRCTAQQTVPLQYRQNSNLRLYCTADSATVAPVEQQSIAVLHSRQCHCSTGGTAICCCTSLQTVPLQHRQNSNLSLYFTPDSGTLAPFLYKFFSYNHYLCVLLPTVHCSTIYTINTSIRSL